MATARQAACSRTPGANPDQPLRAAMAPHLGDRESLAVVVMVVDSAGPQSRISKMKCRQKAWPVG